MGKEYAIGIDIGSTSAKTAVIRDSELVLTLVQPTGWSSVKTAEEIRAHLETSNISMDDAYVVATGYGRVSVPYADRTLTEITCHGRGAAWLFDMDPVVVIDIGGQDTKLIRVADRRAADFLMNDKCSAGTGRFIEIMGGILGLDPAQLCALAKDGGSTKISSLCTVFAESEIVSLIGRGEPKQNIAFAIVDSITEKVAAQVARFSDGSEEFCLTGGLCACGNLVDALSEKIGRPIAARPEAHYAGAIGAALCAEDKIRSRRQTMDSGK